MATPSPASRRSPQTYLRAAFGFLGITDLLVVRTEGLNLGPEQRAAAMEAAHDEPARNAA